MTQIFLVRHGQSEGNLFRRVQGQTDVELTADGRAQLPYLTKRFAETPLAAVYTSPLRRAEETAAAIVGGRAAAGRGELHRENGADGRSEDASLR